MQRYKQGFQLGGRFVVHMTHAVCIIVVKLVQAKQLLALESMSSDRKKEVCDKHASMEREIQPSGVAQLLACGGDFLMAYELAMVECGPGAFLRPGASKKSGSESASCDITSQPDQNARRSLYVPTDASGSDAEHMCDTVCTKAKAEVHLHAHQYCVSKYGVIYGSEWGGLSLCTD